MKSRSPAHIFISFKTGERNAAFYLKEALHKSGFKVWWQEELQCGQEWHGEIDKAIAEAGAIIVLWSKQSMQSQWVKHEASQAIARSVYAPIRIEPMEIVSPYDRIQATDLNNWEGDVRHAGFLNLYNRLLELMPRPIPIWRRALLFLSKNIFSIAVSCILVLALTLLLLQSRSMEMQLAEQKKINYELQRTLQPLANFNASVDIVLDKSTPGLSQYLKSLKSVLVDSATGGIRMGSFERAFVSQSSNNLPLEITITSESLKPQNDTTHWLRFVTGYVDLSLNFRLDKSAGEIEYFDADSSDLTIDINSNNPDLVWNVETNELILRFNDNPDTKFWRSTGRVISVPDLEASELKVELMSTMVPSIGNRALSGKIRNIRSSLKLKYLVLSYSGRELYFDGAKMAVGKGFGNMPTFSTQVREGKLEHK